MSQANSPFILIVDDNSTNLSVLSKALKAAGYKVRMAMDGEDALAQLERNSPALILLDIEMPKMDGFETCRRLQTNPATQRIPVIFMTALADTENKVKGLSLGAVDYITKPFEQEEVLARVKVHWQLKQLTDTLEQQVAERTQALQQAQIQLIQQEKMSALGQMMAGITHEINNPLGFISGNLSQVEEYLKDLIDYLNLYQEQFPNPGKVIEEKNEELEVEYLLEDLPKMITSMQTGVNRIQDISASMRIFSRADQDQKVAFDLHEGIDSTLLILKYRLKGNERRPEIQILKDYGNLSKIMGFPGQLNQVFMNIIANGIDVFDEMSQKHADLKANPPQIRIKTAKNLSNQTIEIRIKDNGGGMPEAVQQKIFDHLFTTKEVGKGTGLGLAISRQIVAEKYGGQLTCYSEVGQGTEFVIEIPDTTP